jgi:hypothetical protein
LKTKSKLVDKFLLHSLSYTPDFEIIFDERFFAQFDSGLIRVKKTADNQIINNNSILYADVKGTYNLMNHHRIFSLTQKIVYDKTGHFINMVTPDSIIRKGKIVKGGFFSRTWVPEGCAWIKNRLVLTRKHKFSDCELLSEIKIKSPIQEQQTRIEL